MTLLLLCLQGKAQGFINLTAQEVRLDSLLPAYTYQKQLGPHYADSTYTVSIEYPEFIDNRFETVNTDLASSVASDVLGAGLTITSSHGR